MARQATAAALLLLFSSTCNAGDPARFQKPMLGVAMIDISDAPKGEDSKPALKWPTRRGSMVARVTKGSPADKAGLESLDIITHVNDERVLDHKEASAALASLKPDEEVELR